MAQPRASLVVCVERAMALQACLTVPADRSAANVRGGVCVWL